MQNDLAVPTSVAVSFDEIPSLKGRPFLGQWFAIEEEMLALFDRATYVDQNPYPYEAGLWPPGMVEGFHLLGVLDHLMNPLIRVTDEGAWAWNYGLDRVRFVSPVRAGERIRLRGVVSDVRTRGEGFLVKSDCVVEIEGRDRPGFIAEFWGYWLRASAAV